jgi:RNA polymerase sigma factor (sigma-70 family)
MSREPKPQELCTASIDAGAALTAEEPHELWAAYVADRGNQEWRNRLVEHYAPWVFQLAASLARKMRFRDPENAVGDALAALVASIVPGYDGRSGFEPWARACIQRKLLNARRAERRAARLSADPPYGVDKQALLDNLPHREPYDGDERGFGRLTAGLSDRQAVVLWLRNYCGLPVKTVSRLLGLSPSGVHARARSAMAAIQEKLGAEVTIE